MTTIYLKDYEVAARYGVGRASIWRWVKTDPTFPKPVSLSAGCTRWQIPALEAWEARRVEDAAA